MDVEHSAALEAGFDLVILAAGNASRLWPLTLETPKVLLGVAGKPAIFHILDQVPHRQVHRVVVVCSPDNINRIRQALTHCFQGQRFRFEFVIQQQSRGPADALQAAQEHFSARPVLVWLGDSLAEFPELGRGDQSFIVVSRVADSARWCMVDIAAPGMVRALCDKPKNSALDAAAIGQYYFANGNELGAALEHGRQLWAVAGAEFELSMVLDFYIERQRLFARYTDSWTDFGTMESYAGCKHWIPERSFNRIDVDARGRLTKKSSSANIIEEMLWYSSIPEDCRILAPRLLSQNLLDHSYDIEYVDYKTLSEYFIFHPLHAQTWEFIIHSFLDMMNRHFWSRPVEIVDIEKRVRLMYYEKTLERIADYIGGIGIQLDRPLVINAVNHGSVSSMLVKIEGLIPQLYTNASKYCSVVHGDLVFSNILCSFPKPIFRLIDPRGTFGKIGPFGDYRYELAKLRQCYDGMYDAVLHNLFDLQELGGNEFRLTIFADRSEVRRIFDHAISSRLQVPLAEVKLIEVLLFFSLVPMHSDPNRQRAYFLRACMSFAAFLESEAPQHAVAEGGVAALIPEQAAVEFAASA